MKTEADDKAKYAPPSTIKGRRLKREEKKVIEETGEKLSEKMANEKHTASSYFETQSKQARE